MTLLISLAAGLLFGLGLILSGMADPAKVHGFLDLGGHWDPSLAFVMGGAIAIGAIGFRLARRRTTALTGEPMHLPVHTEVSLRLILGSAAFGIGWGLSGFCPGPAVVALGAGYTKAWAFVGAMVAGMWTFDRIEAARARAGDDD